MRHRVVTEAGEEFYVDSLSEKTVREEVELRDDEIAEVVSDPEPVKTFKSELEWDDETYLTFAGWINEALQTDAIRAWSCSWPEWDLRFYLQPDARISYEPSEQKALLLPCRKEGYGRTQLGDGHPPGIGELKYVSTKLSEDEPSHPEPGTMFVKVHTSLENTLEEGSY